MLVVLQGPFVVCTCCWPGADNGLGHVDWPPSGAGDARHRGWDAAEMRVLNGTPQRIRLGLIVLRAWLGQRSGRCAGFTIASMRSP